MMIYGEKSIYFNLSFQRDRVHRGGQAWWQEQKVKKSHELTAQSRDSDLEVPYTQSPTPVIYFFQKAPKPLQTPTARFQNA